MRLRTAHKNFKRHQWQALRERMAQRLRSSMAQISGIAEIADANTVTVYTPGPDGETLSVAVPLEPGDTENLPGIGTVLSREGLSRIYDSVEISVRNLGTCEPYEPSKVSLKTQERIAEGLRRYSQQANKKQT